MLHDVSTIRPQMNDPNALNQEDLDALLLLFSEDREEAGRAYENLRGGLARYFEAKGCDDPFDLADETLTRVATKASTFDRSQNSRPSAFVYGFAAKVYLENTRDPRRRGVEFDPALHAQAGSVAPMDEGEDVSIVCLEKCLDEFSAEDRSLIVRYYSKEKTEKIELRKQMAAELGCKMDALHMRVYRIRMALKRCVDGCIKNK